MAKPVTIPNTFATATTSIPLANLDADFSTVATALNDASTYSNYALDSGTVDAYVVTLSGLSTTYQAGLAIQFQATTANTGPCTLNVNGQGAKNIIYPDGSTLSANAIVVGAIVSLMYDGTSFQLLSVKNAAGGGGGGGSVSSVAMSVPAFLQVSGTPITTSGTLAVTYSGTPLPIANGGTGATTTSGIRTTIGAGDVNGPASSTNAQIALFNGTTGKTIQVATTTGMVKATSGVIAAATAGTDYVAPGGALGTPSTGTLTNCTDLPISTGVSGLGSGVATFLATPSSSNLAAAVSDETGSGSLVFATSPTLTTPNLGTPSTITLTNATGLPVSTGISGLGTGVATALAVNVGSAGAFVPTSGSGASGTWSISISGSANAATTATNLASGAANQIAYQTGSGATSFITAPTTASTFLSWNGTAFAWATPSGSGDVSGPSSATSSSIVLFDGTTGKLVKNFTTGVAYLSAGGEAYVSAAGQLFAKYSLTVDSADTTGLVLNSATSGNSVTFKPPSSGGNSVFTLPAGYGTANQVLQTNGSGTLSWATVSGGGGSSTAQNFAWFLS